MTKIHLIGGAPLTGKTTIAKELSLKRNIPFISTDDIRSWMQALLKQSEYPKLLNNFNIDEFYKKYDSAQVVFETELNQCKEVQKGVIAFIKSICEWESYIIEGHAITPEFIINLINTFPTISFTYEILFFDSIAKVKERLYKRGLWGAAEKYPDKYKPLELEWCNLFDEYNRREFKKIKNIS